MGRKCKFNANYQRAKKHYRVNPYFELIIENLFSMGKCAFSLNKFFHVLRPTLNERVKNAILISPPCLS